MFRCIFFSLAIFMALNVSAYAQDIILSIPTGEASLSANLIQFFILLTILSVAPGFLMMVTCFPFMVTVLSILRQAIGVPQTPPNMMIVSLALFLTFYVMQPVLGAAWEQGIQPYIDGNITQEQAIQKTLDPLRGYMEARTSAETSTFMTEISGHKNFTEDNIPLTVLMPSYMITEIERAFKVGFLIYIPFVVIDLVVSSILMAMGMMMLPPSTISLPIKLAFFTLSDGWSLVATALVRSYAS